MNKVSAINNRNATLSIARYFLPPALFRLYRVLFGKSMYKGPFRTWKDAQASSSGYDSLEIIERTAESSRKIRSGEALYERDSVLFDEIQYSWPLLAGLLWIASRSGNRLTLTDFGGALGSSYYQNRGFLGHLESIRWCIVEQDRYFTLGKKEFENEQVRFYRTIEEPRREQSANAILLSSVLQYIEKPFELVERIGASGYEYVLIDRTPFVDGKDDRVYVQIVPPAIYDASYPCWFFGIDKFLDAMSRNYRLIAGFEGQDRADDVAGATFKGFLYVRKT